MADYRLTDSSNVVRTKDGAVIPADPSNSDWVEYQAWVKAGNVADAYVAPPQRDPIDSWDVIHLKMAFNHENRIRAIEGKNPVTVAQFKSALKSL